jgi:hypothetical protein
MTTPSLPERALVEYAAEALQELVPSGWRVEAEAAERDADRRVDGVIRLTDAAGERIRLLIEAKGRATPGALSSWAATVADRAPWLLVAPELSDRSKDVLRQAGINWIDTAGSVSLRLPRVFVEIDSPEGRRKQEGLAAVGRSLVMPYFVNESDTSRFVSDPFAGEALRIVRRLLADPTREWRVTEMADAARVTKGWVSRVFATLERDAYLLGPPRGPRRLVDPQGLLDAWAESPAPSQPEIRAVTTESLERLRRRIAELPPEAYAVTADAAADLVAPFARVSLIELYINPELLRVDEALKTLRARETSRGANVVLLPVADSDVIEGGESLAAPNGSMQIVSRPQLYVDLHRRGGASREAAAFLKERGAIWPPE